MSLNSESHLVHRVVEIRKNTGKSASKALQIRLFKDMAVVTQKPETSLNPKLQQKHSV